MGSFFGFGYLTQLTSFAALLLSTVILPNILGIEHYAELNVWLALVMLPCGFLAEAVSFQISKQYNVKRGDFFAIKNILFVALECFVISSLLFFIILLLGGGGTVTLSSFDDILKLVFPLLSILFLSMYMVIVGWFRALFSNKNTLKLVTINGALNFMVPVLFYFLSISFSLVPFVIYFLSFLCAILLFISSLPEKLGWGPKDRYQLVLFNSDFLLFVFPTLQRSLLIWLPVLWLFNHGSASEQAAYKIAVSIAFGGIALVPFPRETVFSISMSLSRKGLNRKIIQLSKYAVGIAFVGSLMLYFLRNHIVRIFYSSEFSIVAEYLQIISFFIVLQVLVDVLTNNIITKKQKFGIYISFFASMALGGIALYLDLIPWVPIFMSVGFVSIAFLYLKYPIYEEK